MSASGLFALRDLLAARYDDFKRRLTWRLGSADLANDALHDTWVHLEQRNEQNGPVQNPSAYLLRMATNLALDRLQRDKRYMDADELDALLADLPDPSPGPAEVAAARSDIDALADIIGTLPPRRRAIFLAIRVENLSHGEVASRFGISARLVGLELKRAHEYCMSRLPREGT